jgi:hypothetical protein
LSEALAAITRHVQDGEQFDALVHGLTAMRGRLQRMIASVGGLAFAIAAIHRRLGVAPGETPDAIVAAASMDSAFDAALLRKACAVLADGSKTDRRRAFRDGCRVARQHGAYACGLRRLLHGVPDRKAAHPRPAHHQEARRRLS